MKIVMAQHNYTVGDIAGNLEKILGAIHYYANTADLIVFSELCITGYYPKDLLGRESLITEQDKALTTIQEATKAIAGGVIIGAVERNAFAGKPFFNALLLIENGQILYRYHKQLLPTYGVFDEARHFQPGTKPGVFEFRGWRLGFLVCEDAWEDPDNPLYLSDPVAQLENINLDAVISINASPCNVGKHKQRYALVREIAQRCQASTLYVNQVGGIDDLVFDGGSIAYNRAGICVGHAPLYEEGDQLVDLDAPLSVDVVLPDSITMIAEQLKLGLQDYCRKTGFRRVVIGCSGGIDSAVTLAIAAWALGAENVIAITMPSQYSSAGSVDDSIALCDNLGVKLATAPIGPAFDLLRQSYEEAFGEESSPLAQENLQARIRGLLLMAYSNSKGTLVLSSGNKSELAVGYCTLYGDMSGGLSLLGDVYKLQVYALARYLNNRVFKRKVIPNAIIEKAPSAELAPDQKDSDVLPPYNQLDSILKIYLEADLLAEDELEGLQRLADKVAPEEVKRIHALVDRNEYKRKQAAPVIRVNRRAFGVDRQIPITARMTLLYNSTSRKA